MTTEITNRMQTIVHGLETWWKRNFPGCLGAVYHLSLLVGAVLGGVSLGDMLWPGALGNTAFTVSCFAALELGGWIAAKLAGLLLRWGSRWLVATGVLAAGVWIVTDNATSNPDWQVGLFTASVCIAVQGTAVACAALCRRRATPTIFALLLCCGGLAGAIGVLVFTDGFDDHYVENYLSTAGLPTKTATDALETGPYAVKTLDYGTEEGLPSDTVNLTRYMSRSSLEGLSQAQVELYIDYDLNAVPLVGRVWYPEGGEDCPVLFIAHGNHVVTVDSYLGYAYLGEYLASWGYVVVSVDHNACNMLSGENDGRAVLLLEHVGQVLRYSEDPSTDLYGVIDPERIALAGHSRGGETAATAALFNQYDRYPENGTILFDYHYNIRSVIAIAPTSNQYEPGDHSVELEDVNYLLLHGTNDQDVTNFQGMNQYENITFTGDSDCIKSALLIAGANHGQFNSLWQDEDKLAPASWLLNVENFITMEEQQAIAQRMIRAFLDVTLQGDNSDLALLTDWRSRAEELPATVYSQCYETSGFTVLADFEEDSDMESGSAAGVTLHADGIGLWTEELVTYHDGGELDNYAVRLRSYGNAGTYTLTIPEADLTGKSVRFDISDYDSDSVERRQVELLRCAVEVTDANGNTARAEVADFATVFPPQPVRLSKLDYIFGAYRFQYSFSTVDIPAEAFQGDADLSCVTSIAFLMEEPSHIRLDNIGIAG